MQERELTRTTTDLFSAQFGRLHDAVVHQVRMDLFSRTKPYDITVTLGAKQAMGAWQNVILRFDHVICFELQQGADYTFAIILDAEIAFSEGHVCVDFYPHVTHREGFDNISRRTGTRGPMFIIVSKHCFWSTEPYAERDGAV